MAYDRDFDNEEEQSLQRDLQLIEGRQRSLAERLRVTLSAMAFARHSQPDEILDEVLRIIDEICDAVSKNDISLLEERA